MKPEIMKLQPARRIHKGEFGSTACNLLYEDLDSQDVIATDKNEAIESIRAYDDCELCKFCYTEIICEFKK